MPDVDYSCSFERAVLDTAIRLYGVVSGSPIGAHRGIAGLGPSRKRSDLFWIFFFVFWVLQLALCALIRLLGWAVVAVVCTCVALGWIAWTRAAASPRPASVRAISMLFQALATLWVLTCALSAVLWVQRFPSLVTKLQELEQPAIVDRAWIACVRDSFSLPQTSGWLALRLFLQVFSAVCG